MADSFFATAGSKCRNQSLSRAFFEWWCRIFSLEHSKRSYLSDANQQLINAYIQVRDNPQQVIERFLQFHNTEEDYYIVRSEFTMDNTIDNAARQKINEYVFTNIPEGESKNE